ncbi:hypothetical protein AKJ16_DCAP03578 [Drosera capensis]
MALPHYQMDHGGMGWKRRSGQIPAFGNWDYVNELPITQYFESAREAGLIRSRRGCCSMGSGYSGVCDCCDQAAAAAGCCDLYAADLVMAKQWADDQYPPVTPMNNKNKKKANRARENPRNIMHEPPKKHQQREKTQFWSNHEAAPTPRTTFRRQQGGGGGGGARSKVFDYDATVARLASPTSSSGATMYVAVGDGKRVKENGGLDVKAPRSSSSAPKAVDEDLYKIPPHLLRSSRHHRKQKKRLGFIRSCWGPAC